ncbi:MAG: hypothetical protein KDD50_05825 [Bdellovibrionales bacterium]|nr:hypothetical protein [Bdellovibrionales bacterium]
MGDLLFFLKMIVMTFFFVLFLQIRIGQFTVEERAITWAHNSELMQPLQEVAQGAVVAIKRGWSEVVGSFGDNVSGVFNRENIPGHRQLIPKLERSKKYLNEQLDKAEAKIDELQESYPEVVEQPKKLEQRLEKKLEQRLKQRLQLDSADEFEPTESVQSRDIDLDQED